jgi:ATP/maltotriose-dependent transcriptional regulator MalT
MGSKLNRKSDILNRKLLAPLIDESIMDRPRLMDKILSARPEPSIVFFNAPAGYGKTILMAQYCAASENPFIWYQLDARDDPATFLKHLVDAIKACVKESGNAWSSRITRLDNLKKQRQFITELFDELSSHDVGRIIIAIDDYHHLAEPAMHSLFEEFVNLLPPEVQLCMASRTPLPFSLSRLTVEGKVITIDNQAFRFTKDEIIAYLGAKTTKDKSSELIAKQTEGWAVALRLMKNAISGNEQWEPIKNKQLFEYLADEVFQHQPDYVQQFLLRTSILEILTPEHCDLLLERNDSGKTLKFLNTQQLFVTPLADDGAYRYHQLFLEFLLKRLGNGDKDLFYRAGTVMRNSGNIEKAVEYFDTAGAGDEKIRLILENGKQTLGHGRWKTVRNWLSGLSQSQINQEPWLILFQAEVNIYTGRLVEAEHLLVKAEALFKDLGDRQGQSEALSQQARILRSQGRYKESLKIFDQAMLHSMAKKYQNRFDFSIENSFALALAGRFQESDAVLTEALKIAQKEGDEYLIANFSEALSNLYFLKGDYAKSLEMYRRAVNVSAEPIQTSYYMRDSVALIYRDWGELDRALEQAERSIAVKEKLGLVEVLPYAYYQLASIQTDLGKFENAEENYRRSIKIAEETGGERVFRIMSMCMLAKLLLMRNQFVEASSLAEEALELSKKQSSYVIAFTEEMVAPVFLHTGRAPEAVGMLFNAAAVLEEVGAKYPLCIACGALSTILLMQGDVTKAEAYARQCLELAARENYLQIFVTTYDLFQPVLKIGLEKGIETLFVQRALVRSGMRAMALILSLATAPEAQVRRRVVIPLAETGGVEARKAFQQLINDSDPEVKRLAIRLAGRTGIVRTGDSSKGQLPLLRFEMLGNLKIYVKGAESATSNWTTLKSRDLLIYLAHCGEAVTKGRILEDLWPNKDAKKSDALFHTTLYNLRQLLGKLCHRKDVVIYSGGKYKLREELYITDRSRFEHLLAAAMRPEKSQTDVINGLREATELYRGDYLAEMDYMWLVLTREHLELSYHQAMKQLGRHYMDKGDYYRAMSCLRVLAVNDPFAEDIICMLMQSYAGAGNLVSMREMYHSFADSLEKEMGISPSPETARLFNQLTKSSQPPK